MDSLEHLENLSKPYVQVESPEEISDFGKVYLQELNFNNEDWENLTEAQQLYNLQGVESRLDELGIEESRRDAIVCELFSSAISDAYSDYQVKIAWSRDSDTKIEAPHDSVQIEQISDVLADCSNLKYENWINLELSEKESVLNQLEVKIAEIEHRPICPIRLQPMNEGLWGGYNPETKTIDINSCYAELSDYDTYREVVDTLVHEGRHAYQDYNVNVCQIHPRNSEVSSWADVMEGGKWPYWNDCSTMLGQRLYEQQSIEIDARNFAADVMKKWI